MTDDIECPCCRTKLSPCPFCGKPGKIYGENMVGCEDWRCGANIDFGHWCGFNDKGIPAVHHVIEQWNKRVMTAKLGAVGNGPRKQTR